MVHTRATSMGWGRVVALAAGLSILALSAANATGATRSEAPAESLGGNAAYGLGAFLGTVIYAPMKLIVALGGSLTGGVAWAVTGGDDEVAESIVRPSITGDYVITTNHLRGDDPLELLGGTRSADSHYYAYEDGELPPVGAGIPVPRTCTALPSLTPLRFAVDDATLSTRQERLLGEVATTLTTCPDARFRLEGHADAQGEGPYNFTLSLRRAMQVKGFLVAQGIAPERLQVAGLGERNPASTNDTDAGRAANRRVELRSN